LEPVDSPVPRRRRESHSIRARGSHSFGRTPPIYRDSRRAHRKTEFGATSRSARVARGRRARNRVSQPRGALRDATPPPGLRLATPLAGGPRRKRPQRGVTQPTPAKCPRRSPPRTGEPPAPSDTASVAPLMRQSGDWREDRPAKAARRLPRGSSERVPGDSAVAARGGL
jgi:hypothetical protein